MRNGVVDSNAEASRLGSLEDIRCPAQKLRALIDL
jgi:hypothetical protein